MAEDIVETLLAIDDDEDEDCCIMTVEQFKTILEIVDFQMQLPEGSEVTYDLRRRMLAATIRYLGTLELIDEISSLAFITPQVFASNLRIVLDAIYNCLHPIYVKYPQTPSEWQRIREDFEALWHFPLTLASVVSFEYSSYDYHMSLIIAVDAHSRLFYMNVSDPFPRNLEIVCRDVDLSWILLQGAAAISEEMALCESDTAYYFAYSRLGNHSIKRTTPFGKAAFYHDEECGAFCATHKIGDRLPANITTARIQEHFPRINEPLTGDEQYYASGVLKACFVLLNYLTPPLTEPPIPQGVEMYPDTFDLGVICHWDLEGYSHKCMQITRFQTGAEVLQGVPQELCRTDDFM